MRIGVYNQFWSTVGGGEQYAGGIAEALAQHHDVTLITPVDGRIDADLLLDRLSIDVRELPVREVTAESLPVSAVSLDYEVFINVSFQSTAHNLAETGLYVAHFPTERFTLRQQAGALARSLIRRVEDPSLRSLGGLVRAAGRSGCVIAGQALLQMSSTRPVELGLTLRSEAARGTRLQVIVGRAVAEDRLVRDDANVTLTIPPGVGVPVFLIATRPDVSAPGGPGAHRALALEQITIDGRSVDPLAATLRQRLAPLPPRAYLETYDRIVANSEFTRLWIGRRWGRDCSVLHPPVRMRARGDKEPLIVSVGRFFGEHAGHTKRQLEMVQAFRRIVDGGLDGWRLVLIGGCDAAHREYAMAVKREALGLPVEVRLNAPGDVLDEALAHASIYWHAAGLGLDAERHPDGVEHFGIAPIEAMSAGAVPIVYGVGGPAEVVEHGVSGLHFRTIDELVESTQGLIATPSRLAALCEAAIARARDFSLDRFKAATVKLVEEVADSAGDRGAPTHGVVPGDLGVAGRVQRLRDPRRRWWGARSLPFGAAVRCNICGWRGRAFEGEPHSESALCPSCGSIARDRFLFHCYVERNPFRPELRVLETSPRLGDAYKHFMSGWCRYFSSDFEQSAHSGAVCLDLQSIGVRAESIDVVLTPHVLEHVPDTEAAIAELHRVVAPGGVVYLQVPVQQGRTTPPPEPEYHSDNTFVFWRFGFDLTARLRARGFNTVLLATADFARRAARGEPWLGHPGFPDDLLADVIVSDLEVVASDEEARLRGFEPSFWFLTWECRRP
jgi:glycosyltransferase involved in cell wall biosynthesis